MLWAHQIFSQMFIWGEIYRTWYFWEYYNQNEVESAKFEVQDEHFSGKKYTLHCAIAEPGEQKYVYHLSDDTVHDPTFVNEILADIFRRWNIRDERITVKSDKAQI